MKNEAIDILSQQFSNFIETKEKRPGITQLLIPVYHADGDIMEIFLEEHDSHLRISDCGMTLMRLSYSYDIDTDSKERIFNKILHEDRISNIDGTLFIDTNLESIYPNLMQLVQCISKILNMRLYRREIINSMFFELLEQFVMEKLAAHHPVKRYFPLESHNEYEVDYCFNGRPKPIFLFGVNSSSSSRLATISCQKFMASDIPFRSLIVYENIEDIGKKDQARLMSAADKQFPTLDDFIENGAFYLEREK